MKLQIKVPLLIAAILLVLGILSAAVQLYSQRKHVLDQFQETAQTVNGVIKGSLEHDMLTGDRANLQQALVAIGQSDFITRASVLRPDGVVVASSQVDAIGQLVGGAELGGVFEGTQTHAGFRNLGGKSVFYSIGPVLNEAACQQCHSVDQQVLGAVEVTLDTSSLSAQMQQQTTLIAVLDGVTFILVGGGLALMLKKTVLDRLSALSETAQSLSYGDYSARSKVTSSDEVGVLAHAFNEMAANVQERNREVEESRRKLSEWNAELEERVQRRTAELSELNRAVQDANRMREQLLEKLISAQEEERRRIARDLHDEASQSLAAVAINLENVAETLPARHKMVRQRLETLKEQMVSTLADIRGLALELRPSALDDLGLPSAIDWYAKDYLKKRGLDVKVEIIGSRKKLPTHTETMLFRIAQEALTNIVRHAEARSVVVHLEYRDAGTVLRIEDDGKGFNVGEVLSRQGMRQNLGIYGMTERATLLGGKLTIHSEPGKGTVLLVEVPQEKNNEQPRETDQSVSGR